MENASKALLIAGGMLLVLLIIGVVIFAWNSFSEFYNNKDELTEIDNVSKFNSQIASYDRSKVHGYELISLANKIADYNMQYSNYENEETNEKARNNEGYTPITMKISFPGTLAEQKIWYDSTYSKHIFENGKEYVQSSISNQIVNLITTVTGYEKIYGNVDITTKLAKSINSLIIKNDDQIAYYANSKNITFDEAKEELEKQAVASYNRITNGDIKTYSQMENILLNMANIKQYYEFYQFKRAIFECDTNSITYNASSGRIENISFIFTGKIE